jgi:septum formation protein
VTGRAPDFLILASGSPRRKALLRDLGLALKIVPAEIPEKPGRKETPAAFARRMATEKAHGVSSSKPEDWVLGADTVVALQGKIFGKPKTEREAKAFLQELSGKTHRVITAFCLCHHQRGVSVIRSVETRVTFKTLSPREIKWYGQTGEPRDKAGAYAIQGKGAFCVQEIRGSYTNVVGLPVTEVLQALEEFAGFRIGK